MIKSFNEFVDANSIDTNIIEATNVDFSKGIYSIGTKAIGTVTMPNNVIKYLYNKIPGMQINKAYSTDNDDEYYMYLPRGVSILTLIDLLAQKFK